ncbi:MAG: ABC transporter permease [Planctomycetaceae bacterium]
MDPVVEVRGLTKTFGALTAVRDVSFEIERGSIYGLLGPNGSGKSTIIRMLCGVLPPTAGNGWVLGFDIQTEAEQLKRQIGYMSQSFSLYADLSVQENLDFYGGIYGLTGEHLAERQREVLELTSMGDRTRQLAGTLSGGWKQRLALACSLIHEPSLLFLDEPTAGIDPVARRDLWDLLFRLAGDGVTMLVTTHYMDEAERCSRIGYIYNSRLIANGTPAELKNRSEVTPPGTRRWELLADDPVGTLRMLHQAPEVRDATFFGQAIHVLAEENWSPERDIGSVSEAREITPSLEDVFVTLTRKVAQETTSGHRTTSTAIDSTVIPDSAPDESEAAPTTEVPTTLPPSSPSEADSPTPAVQPLETRDDHRAPATADRPTPRPFSTLFGLGAILRKEFAHIRRQPSTLVFALAVPVLQTFIFGVAIDTEIEHIPAVVYDLDGRTASRDLISAFENTRTFEIKQRVHSDDAFRHALTAGRAKVGLRIPPNYSERLLTGEQAEVQVLIDGSDSQVATAALQASNLLGLNMSLARAKPFVDSLPRVPSRSAAGHAVLPIEVRPRLLYNPNLESAHFFVPGLVGIILQLVTLFLTSFAIVRERELGTLEQLFVTPVGRAGLLLGKLVPYALLGFVETLIVLCVMVYGFGVPIRGDLLLLVLLSTLFLVCGLALGLLVSTLARTQVAAIQFAFLIMLPSVLLSGFMFPRAQMPFPIYLATYAIPVTHFLEILRGIVLRGADFADLTPHILGLTLCTIAILGLSLSRFHKQLE